MSDITIDRSFGGYLKRLRIEKKITLRQMALNLQMDVGNLSKLENSKLDPPQSKYAVLKLVNYYAPVKEGMFEFMVDLAFNFHLAKFKNKWE